MEKTAKFRFLRDYPDSDKPIYRKDDIYYLNLNSILNILNTFSGGILEVLEYPPEFPQKYLEHSAIKQVEIITKSVISEPKIIPKPFQDTNIEIATVNNQLPAPEIPEKLPQIPKKRGRKHGNKK